MKIVCLTMMIMLGCISTALSADQPITHVVVVWINEDVSAEAIDEIIHKSNVLSTVDGVQDIKIGRPVASERETVDDSFSFAISVQFENDAAMQKYIVDATHREFVQSEIRPVLKKLLVYDFQ
jgi:hypothetical protein